MARALIARRIVPRVLLTGQHAGLDLGAHGFPDVPFVDLGCRGLQDPHAHAASVSAALLPHLSGLRLLIVQGDTSSAFGGALAAAEAGVSVAHVEAGLRSHDSRHPWPEEDFRIAIDRIAALLFAPTELSAANLRREQLAGAIHVTGNSGIDAALARPVATAAVRDGGSPRLLVTCHRRESWGEGLESIAAAVNDIACAGIARVRFVLHPNPDVADTMRRLLAGAPGVELCPPCSHGEMLQAMCEADLILSDSGGMQEEAPLLGVPLIVLRKRTERPEAIASGNIALVGTSRERIVATVRRLLSDPRQLARMSRRSHSYGDGLASARIADIVADWVGVDQCSRAA